MLASLWTLLLAPDRRFVTKPLTSRHTAQFRLRPELVPLEVRVVPATFTFSNAGSIAIPDSGIGTPYPSTIAVSGLTGLITDVNVQLNGLTHTWPDDIDVLLVGPTGANAIIMSDTGSSVPVTGVNLTLDDEAAVNLPAGTLTTGSYRPTNLGAGDPFPAPAPAPSGNVVLTAYDGTAGNGTWSLYVVDDVGGDLGSFAGGWSLVITIPDPPPVPPTISNILNQTTNEDFATGLIGFTADDNATPPDSLIYTATSSNPALVPNGNIAFGGSGTARTIQMTPLPNEFGSTTITVTVTDAGGLTAQDTFVLTVNPVNDVPSFIRGPNQVIAMNLGAQTVSNWATFIRSGPTNESGQILNFLITTDNNGLFSTLPAVNPANGDLTYTPTFGTGGPVTVTVRLMDDGGTANGGVNTSAPQIFTIQIGQPNVGPVNTVPNVTVTAQEDTPQNVTGISFADADAAGLDITVTLGVQQGILTLDTTIPGGLTPADVVNNGTANVTLNASLSQLNTTLAANGGLRYLATNNYSGPDNVTVTSNDGGNFGYGGALGDSDLFSIDVAAVADAPTVQAFDVAGFEGQPVALNINVGLNDLDGSEQLGLVVIGGMPAAATLNTGINNGNGTWTLTAAGLVGLTLTAPDDGIFILSVTASANEVSNTSTASANTTFQADFQNLAPTLAVQAPTAGVRGQRLAFTLTPTDPSVVDQAVYFTFDIDWDTNGIVDESILGLSGTVVTHIFPGTGIFNVRITAFDADSAQSNIVDNVVNVTVIGLQTDPIDPTKTALAIGGTSLNDVITFKKGATVGSVIATLNGVAQPTFTPTGRILAFGQNGHDNIKASKKINLPVWFDGGDGDDTITGGLGADIIQGQAGNDVIKGGDGRDLIIGGVGLDNVKGGVGDDLIIGSSTVYDANDAALGLIQSEWTSGRTYTTRIQNLRGIDNASFAARLNAQVFLITAITVEDDNQIDTLSGNTELDWFFADLVQDKLTDVLPAELAIAI